MDNKELELKLQEILKIEDYCEYAIAIKQFEPQYKKSDFYKLTKISLRKALQEARLHYLFNVKNLIEKVQYFINNLNYDNVQHIIEQASAMFAAENEDIQDTLEVFKDIMNNKNTNN